MLAVVLSFEVGPTLLVATGSILLPCCSWRSLLFSRTDVYLLYDVSYIGSCYVSN
jgi:hypothetical protein